MGKLMLFLKKSLLMLSLFVITACSGTYRAYTDMFKLALTKTPDVVLPYSVLSAAQHDYLYVRHGSGAQVAMALMFIEQAQLKWVSAERTMLVTEQGRIVRTIGLENDLLFLSNTQTDPIKSSLNLNNSHWQRLADWQQQEYGYQLKSSFSTATPEPMQFFGHTLMVIPVTETVRYVNQPNFVRFDDKWQNHFWLAANSGTVIKSRQKLSPSSEEFELIFISEVVRQLSRAGINVAADAV